MRSISFLPLIYILTLSILSGCENEKEEFSVTPASEYFALAKGKYITYRLDSFVFVQQGRTEETHYYEEKHVIDDAVTDNLGRASYRVFRFLRDTARMKPWASAGSYFITPLSSTVEVIEDNLRVVKLAAPLTVGHTWKGYRFLSSDPYQTKFSFSNDDDMNDWDFTIDARDETVSFYGKTYDSVLTVKSIDETLNVPITDLRSYATRTLYTEKYSKGIGLISQDFIMWEYQPGTTSGFKTGFGVKRRIIDHN